MKLIQLRTLEDLVRLLGSSPSIGAIQHTSLEGRHIYFVLGGTFRETFIYYVVKEEEVQGKYIVYNGITGEIFPSKRLRTEPNLTSIPIIEIEKQDVFSKAILEG